MANQNGKPGGLKTFEGVYVPTVLTILGVIMYLRLGWVVGNTGLGFTLLIIVIAHIITICTALSMSSMLTNIQIGPGGAYAIIKRSLGLEMGGAIGIPLYLSQALSVAFYISGFSELWITFFPDHSIKVVGALTWLILTSISLISAKFAFRVQYFIFGAVVLSLISFYTGPSLNTTGITMTGAFPDASFWATFAIFFPAVTGILTGATMSGELANPRKSIIQGTLGAVLTGFVVYIINAIWFAKQVPTDMLLSNNSVILEVGSIRILIIAGIMGAVLSSALSTLVSAPRTLSALSEDRVVPFSRFFTKRNSKGEPINAILFSSIISLVVIILGSLDSLAELLTMFFLTTYLMINMVVFIEQITGVTSFRPTMKLPLIVPLIGAFGCFFAMILINPVFSIITLLTILIIYSALKSRNLTSPWGDVRGGIFISISEWAAQRSVTMPYHPRLWKPSIVIPVEHAEDFHRISGFVNSLINPAGRIYYLSIYSNDEIDSEEVLKIDEALAPLVKEKLFVQKVLIHSDHVNDIIEPTLQVMTSSFLPPNAILFTISDDQEKRLKFKQLLESIRNVNISLMCLWQHPKVAMGMDFKINIWLRDKSPNNDLAVLSAIQMVKNMNAQLYLCRVIRDRDRDVVEAELKNFIDEARLPVKTKINLFSGNFYEIYAKQHADFNILGMPQRYEEMIRIIEKSNGSILFVSSGGLENALL